MKKLLIGICAVLTFSAIIYWPGKALYNQLMLYKWGVDSCKELGHEKMTGELYDVAQQALEHMRVPLRSLVQVYKTHDCSCSTPYHIWLNTNIQPGPIEFDVFHEVAHIALGHPTKRFFEDISQEEARAQEVEADLLACQMLFELGKSDVIDERIKILKECIDREAIEPDLDDHPTLDTIYTLTCNFARSKGWEVA